MNPENVEPDKKVVLRSLRKQENGAVPRKETITNAVTKRDVNFMHEVLSREARTIKESARLFVFREVLLFVTIVLVIAGAIGGIWYSYHKRNEAARIEWQREQARKKQAEEEMARREEQRKQALEAERRAREAERKRLEAAREAERLAREKAAKAEVLRKKRLAALLNEYKDKPLDYLKNAPRHVLPGNVKVKTLFSCIMVNDVNELELFCVNVTPGEPMKVSRVSADSKSADVPLDEFNKRCQTEPYLMVVDGAPYFKPQKRSLRVYPVPLEGEKLSPAKDPFGALYPHLLEMGIDSARIRYKVFLQSEDGSETLPVREVGFGDSLSRDVFRNVVREKMLEEARGRAEEYSRAKAARALAGRTRSGRTQADSRVRSLQRQLDRVNAEIQRSYFSSGSSTRYVNGNVIYHSTKERSGPTTLQLRKKSDLEARLAEAIQAQKQRAAVRDQRQAESDALFEQKNAVTDADVDKRLAQYGVLFRTTE